MAETKNTYDPQEFTEPGFNQLRNFLESSSADSPRALAAIDIAKQQELLAAMAVSGGIHGRLQTDRENFQTGNFDHNTIPLLREHTALKQQLEQQQAKIILEQVRNPDYDSAVEFIHAHIVTPANRPLVQDAVRLNRVAQGLVDLVAEVCLEPYEGKHRTS